MSLGQLKILTPHTGITETPKKPQQRLVTETGSWGKEGKSFPQTTALNFLSPQSLTISCLSFRADSHKLCAQELLCNGNILH